MKQIKSETLETVKNYLLTSILPSRDVQELVRLLNEAEEINEISNPINKLLNSSMD